MIPEEYRCRQRRTDGLCSVDLVIQGEIGGVESTLEAAAQFDAVFGSRGEERSYLGGGLVHGLFREYGQAVDRRLRDEGFVRGSGSGDDYAVDGGGRGGDRVGEGSIVRSL